MSQPKPSILTRFTLDRRIEHIFLITSFTILCLTGLPQKFSGASWAEALIAAMGGIETVRIIHRIAATVFILEIVYHLVALGYKAFVLRKEMSMLPGGKDVRDAFQAFFYNLGFAKHRPRAGRYSFDEKLEYWAMVWGSIIMILTGLMMWNPIATTNFLPGQVIPAAKAAHGAEALLAFLGILIWHFYNVHLRHFNKSIFTGRLTHAEMEHEHPLELNQIEAQEQAAIQAAAIARRKRVYYPIAGVATIVLLVGIYVVLTFEKTSVQNAPAAETALVYSPQTPTPIPTAPPTLTPIPQAAGNNSLTWNGSVGPLFQQRCDACHGGSGGLTVSTYADLMKGGAQGVEIIAGSADTSPLIVLQAGSHPGKFSAAELDQVKAWINAGAPER